MYHILQNSLRMWRVQTWQRALRTVAVALLFFGWYALPAAPAASAPAGAEMRQDGPVPPVPYYSTATPEGAEFRNENARQPVENASAPSPTASPTPTATASPTVAPTDVPPTATPEPPTPAPPTATPTTRPFIANSKTAPVAERVSGSLTVALAPNLPDSYASPVRSILDQTTSVSTGSWLKRPLHVLNSVDGSMDAARIQVKMEPLANTRLTQAQPVMERYYVVVAPFDTLDDDISLSELRLRWQGLETAPLYVTESAARDLPAVLGTRRVSVLSEESWNTLFASTPDAIGILPFDRLDPSYKVLTVDGLNPLDKALDPLQYPLAVALTVSGEGAPFVAALLNASILPRTNRDTSQMTTLIMTGVTAMTRGTAARMEANGYTYPAEVISATLRAADITHISNEVPFLDDCVVNATPNNLIMCSHTDYWATLEAVGTDIVGLSGNHVNDFGREGALRSIGWYRDNGIPIYGSGFNAEEACAPLQWYHNGNRFAFIATLAYGPPGAWATDEQPGACYYYDHKEEILETVAELSQQVDIVAIELQYEETYNPFPTNSQIFEFRELRDAGADIVTGVQSHVPQSFEVYGSSEPGGAGSIAYGLGNLFFDQMWSWETRTELAARHTIYGGRLLSTEILTMVLEDYAQPRWATPDERIDILQRIFNAAPPKPQPSTSTTP